MGQVYYPGRGSSHLKFLKLFRLLVLTFVFSSLIFSIKSNAAVAEGGYMVLQNMDGFPANDQLVFSRIQIPWRRTDPVTEYNANHDMVTLRILNKGYGELAVTGLGLSNTSAWEIVSVNGAAPAFPLNIAKAGRADVVIRFTATLTESTRVRVFHDKLTITSDDVLSPSKEVLLHGLFQYEGEGNHEPFTREIIDAFNSKSEPGYNHTDGAIDGTAVVPNSDEITASYFVRADATKPVTVHQLAAYHGCCNVTETFRYFAKGSSDLTALFVHNKLDSQSLLPRKNGATTPASGTFTPSGAFGIQISTSSSDRALNPNTLIGLRFLKAKDAAGNVIPNAYFVDHDYIDNSFTNYDYQDNVYYIENVKPESGSVHNSTLAATTGSASYFDPTMTGASKQLTVTVRNNGSSYSDGSVDPDIQVTGVQITGPSASEFSVGSSTPVIPAQGTASFTVNFNPTSVGPKNAALLVSYNNSLSPLRIPLYGNANAENATVETVKRIKGGSTTGLTLNGVTYEADASYATGSVRNDSQVTASDVAGTDLDPLYRTYLSANSDLAQTGYNIPITNGDYIVRMHFVENFFPSQGSRVFNGVMEGQQIISNLDIFREVGYRTAIVKDFNTTVSDGRLNINFIPSANRLAIAALEIMKINGSPLPVTLVSFKGAKEGPTGLLTWTTATETNAKHFEIERSQTGKDWQSLGEVQALGESNTNYTYSFSDMKPLSGENLYRLKMVDFDETFAYSSLVSLTFEGIKGVYPNPVVDRLNIEVADWSKVDKVQLFNTVGKVVFETENAAATGVDVHNLPSGMYIVHITNTDGTFEKYKVVKY